MLAPDVLLRLATDLESDRVERKASLADPDKLRQAICAFANNLAGHGDAGYLLVGVTDDGKPAELPITDELLRTLADMRSDGNILPLPGLSVYKAELHGRPVAVVEVVPCDGPPVRYRGRVWVRVGPRRAIATPEEERRLSERAVAGTRTFDLRPCSEARLEDLALDSFRTDYLPRVVAAETLAENRKRPEEQLASLRFFDLRRGVPTHAGLLLFGKEPGAILPGAYVQVVRFDGVDRADPVQDQKELRGNLRMQLARLDDLLPLQIHTARIPAGGLRHEDVPDYPLLAVRELVFNALMHRTYEGTNAPVRLNWFDNRVEILSPGGLFGQVTPQNYEHVSDYRNPVLSEAMKILGYVERFGAGIARAKAALRKNGNPPLELTFETTHVLAVLRRGGTTQWH